jgi:hypothetical protein
MRVDFADRLEGGEVDHGVDVLLAEDAIQQAGSRMSPS